MSAPLLTARGLTFSYGPDPMFTAIDLDIGAQEIVCLIGASGCGKSTLLRLLAGLATPHTGAIQLQGQDLTARRHDISVVFQSPGLLPWLSVRDNVALGLDFACRPAQTRAQRTQQVDQTLAQVGLEAHADKKPSALSGGMAQRVALARALARTPRIIHLDEPFSALDAITREAMQDLLVDLVHRHHTAALLVTHDIDEALRIGDRVLLLAGTPARLVGEWHPDGSAPRQHRSLRLNAMREEILSALSSPGDAWCPDL